MKGTLVGRDTSTFSLLAPRALSDPPLFSQGFLMFITVSFSCAASSRDSTCGRFEVEIVHPRYVLRGLRISLDSFARGEHAYGVLMDSN